jgi:lysophosphatidic acid phosphatase type 6
VGQTQARELGEALRARYAEALLPRGATSAAAASPALAVRSSNVQRTIATAAGVLTGLFPNSVPSSASAAGAQHSAPPAPIRVADDAVEWVYPNFQVCARLRWLWSARAGRGSSQLPPPPADADAADAAADAPWRRPWARQLAALVAALPPADGAALRTAWGAVELMDHATARAAHGLPPLGATTSAHVSDLRAIAAAVLADVFTGAAPPGSAAAVEGLRLSVGRLLGDVGAAMEAAAARRSPLRLALYAGHDTTVLPLLLAVRHAAAATHAGQAQTQAQAQAVPQAQPEPLTWPPYASHVTFELWGPRERSSCADTAGGGGSVGDQAAAAAACASTSASASASTSSSAAAAEASSSAAAAADGAHYVRVLYNFEALPLACAPPGAPHGACRLADFRASLLAPLVPVDFSEECAAPAGGARR